MLTLTLAIGVGAIILTHRRICHARAVRTGVFSVILLLLITLAVGLCALVIPWFVGVVSILFTAWKL